MQSHPETPEITACLCFLAHSMKSLDLKTIAISGLNLIEASAGTGKTWTIAALYILLLLERELRPEQILVVTYTKAATAELRDRIRRRIATTLELYSNGRTSSADGLEQLLLTERPQNPERARQLLTRALYSFDDAAIFTIHGFCQRALLENAFESGSLFDSDMISDQGDIVRQACDDFWRTRLLGQEDEFVEHLAAENYTPEKLARPFDGHYQNRDLTIIPHTAAVDIKHLIRLRDQLFVPVCSVWQDGRSAILQQLESGHLHQGSYKPEQIAAAARSLDSWVAGAHAADTCSRLEFFSKKKITSKVTKSTTVVPDHPFFSLCQDLSEVIERLEQAYRDRLVACRKELKEWLERELMLRKRALNQRCFDDLLLDLDQALEAPSGGALATRLRDRYQAALIDEFQDTDPLQWNIFKRIGADSDYPLFLIGDPKQAIYSFRGADIYAYLKAGNGVVPGRRNTLGTNFRSVPALVTAVNTLFSASQDPFLNSRIPFYPVQAGRPAGDTLLHDGTPALHPLRFWVYSRSDGSRLESKPHATGKIVGAVAGEIARLLEAGSHAIRSGGESRPLQPDDIAVLVSTHKQADCVQQALRQFGIPSVQQGGSTIFKSAEALDLLRILRAVAEPAREGLVREALLTATMGVSANQVAAFVACSGEDPEWEEWLLRFHDLHTAAAAGGIVAVVSRLLGLCGVRTRLLSRSGGERCLTNVLHCCELLHQAEQEQKMHLHGSVTWLERRISGEQKDETALLRLESDDDAVMIATIHASKGLQYPIVFIPFAWDFPGSRNQRVMFHAADGSLTLDLAGEDQHKKLAEAERAAESARLLYVALTRAEFRCYTIWGGINGAVDSPLFNLLHGGRLKQENKSLAALSDQAILEAVQALSDGGNSSTTDSCITAEPMPQSAPGRRHRNDPDRDIPFSCRTLQQPLRDDWRVASFSGMTSGSAHAAQPRDHDTLTTEAARNAVPETDTSGGVTIFDFPRGAAPGTCLHEIFERLDFAGLRPSDSREVARICLAKNGFHEQWLPAVSGMITDCAASPLIPGDPEFSLSRLKKGAWQSEMEFYLPIRELSPEGIRSLFNGLLDEELYRNFFELLKRLAFRRSRGMLQGFIDLVFEHGGRYYIIDWKSNHLGNHTDDYGQNQMLEAMCRNAYILQYHLYALALDRLLRLRLPGYRYERHFGGAIYVFLRGVGGNRASGSGVYYNRPSEAFIKRAGEELLSGDE